MHSLWIRNCIFTLLQPGVVVGLLPYLILQSSNPAKDFPSPQPFYCAGILLFIPGITIMISCIIGFAVKGQGTLSPADPTKNLVISGMYRFSRNPMYVGVLMQLFGIALFFRSKDLGIYTLMVFLLFFIFIRWFEEPRLRKDFGNGYLDYCKRVRRWI